MSRKKALVIGGGKAPCIPVIAEYMRHSGIVVGADLGAEHLLLAGRIPDVVIGDMDSCSKGVLAQLKVAGCEIIKYPKDKNYTDLEIAIDYCIEQGYTEINVLAAIHGKRIDHILGNVFLLPKYARSGVVVRLCDENGRFIQAISDSIKIEGRIGTYLSLMPLTVRVTGVNSSGLKYPLVNKCITQGSTLAISNQLIAREAEVTIKSGILLVVKEKDC